MDTTDTTITELVIVLNEITASARLIHDEHAQNE